LGRTDSDLDDVWSDVSGELDRGSDLTEFDFNPPQKKDPPKPRPPLISDLEVPVLGAPIEVPAIAVPSEGASLSVGAVLVGSSSKSLLADERVDPKPTTETDNRTMISDAESAAIAHAVSRSLSTGVMNVRIPEVLARDDVSKVVMGKRSEDAGEPPPLPPPPPEENAPLDLSDAPLELAYDPHERAPSQVPPRHALPIAAPVSAQRPLPLKRIGLLLAAIVFIAFVVRFFVHR
jgi:hypothetical protein